MSRELSYWHILSKMKRCQSGSLNKVFHVQTLHYRLKRQHSPISPSWHKAAPLPNYILLLTLGVRYSSCLHVFLVDRHPYLYLHVGHQIRTPQVFDGISSKLYMCRKTNCGIKTVWAKFEVLLQLSI